MSQAAPGLAGKTVRDPPKPGPRRDARVVDTLVSTIVDVVGSVCCINYEFIC